MTGFAKTDLIVTFSISRNTDFKHLMGCGFLVVQYSPSIRSLVKKLINIS